jgi:hypothetical protein
VPRDATLDAMYGCSPGFELFARRLREWWRHLND